MKKIISIILTLAMLMSVTSLVSNADYELPFTDLTPNAWYMEGIAYCYSNGYVKGMTETTFAANKTLTRAEFVQMLAGFSYAELEQYENVVSGFDDVRVNHWFNEAVCWGVSNDVVAGLSETRFGPYEAITREQLASLLFRMGRDYYEADMSYRADISGYDDSSKVSSWAKEAVEWAVAANIISGVGENTLAPRATATRAQACRMLMMFDEYLMLGGPKDTSGIFSAIVEDLYANGERTIDDWGDVVWERVINTENNNFTIRYDEGAEYIDFIYYDYDLIDDPEFDMDTGYASGIFTINTLRSNYGISWDYTPSDSGNYIYGGTVIYDGGCEVGGADAVGYTPEEAKALLSAMTERMIGVLSDYAESINYSYSDFFNREYTPARKNEALAKFCEYVVANGVLNDIYFGEYDVIKTVGTKKYALEHNILSNWQYLSYYADYYETSDDEYSHSDYKTTLIVSINEASDSYDFTMYHYDPDTGAEITQYGILSAEIFDVVDFTYEGITEQEAIDFCNELYPDFIENISGMLYSAGIEFADLFEE